MNCFGVLELRFMLCFIIFIITVENRTKRKRYKFITQSNPNTRKVCLQIDQTLKARHKTCFLRPDTGPCRADIIQWYFDVRQAKCYRFFWGGCQGNGNKFESKQECEKYCYLNKINAHTKVPHFCSLAFDYGNCFGYFNRWTWDALTKSCRRRLYSGCGGNQNNFQSRIECMSTCLNPPNNTLHKTHKLTTCIPIAVDEFH